MIEGHSAHHVLYAVVQVLPEQNHKVYIENPIISTKKLLDLISEFGKQQDTKSIFKTQSYFCTPTMKYQKQKSGKKILFDRATRKIKYLGIKLSRR